VFWGARAYTAYIGQISDTRSVGTSPEILYIAKRATEALTERSLTVAELVVINVQ
jgi:hypothetical protein